VLLWASCVAQAVPPAERQLHITWKQTFDTVSFTVHNEPNDFTNFHYNITDSGEASIVRLVFEKESSLRFARLHLAHKLLGERSRADRVGEGVMLTSTKAQASVWDEVVFFMTENPMFASMDLELSSGDSLPIQVAEYHDIPHYISSVMEEHPEAAMLPGEQQQLVTRMYQSVHAAVPVCAGRDHCRCMLPLVFNSRECIHAGPWLQRATQMVAAASVVFESEDGNANLLASDDLLRLSDAEFAAVFVAHQKRSAAANLWPRMMYTQTFAGKRVLAVGAGMTHYEAVIFAQMKAIVTVLDTELANLKVMERLLNASGVSQANLILALYTGADMLPTLGREFDAVLVLDSLTRGPMELAEYEYSLLGKCLKIGGRWLQLAPAKARHTNMNKPSFNLQFGAGTGATLGLVSYSPSAWYDWMDVPKLKDLLAPATTQVIFEVVVADNAWTWIDLMRTS